MCFADIAIVGIIIIQIDYVIYHFKHENEVVTPLIFSFLGLLMNFGVLYAVSNLLFFHIYLWANNLTTLQYLRDKNVVSKESKIKIKVVDKMP